MSIVFACTHCGSPSIALPALLDDEAVVHCGRCGEVVGRWGPFKALARHPDHANLNTGAGTAPTADRPGEAAPLTCSAS